MAGAEPHSRDELRAIFNEELVFPVYLQNGSHSLVKNILVHVMDRDTTSADDRVSTLNLDFQEVCLLSLLSCFGWLA